MFYLERTKEPHHAHTNHQKQTAKTPPPDRTMTPLLVCWQHLSFATRRRCGHHGTKLSRRISVFASKRALSVARQGSSAGEEEGHYCNRQRITAGTNRRVAGRRPFATNANTYNSSSSSSSSSSNTAHSSTNANSKRKHFWSVDELHQKTQALLTAISSSKDRRQVSEDSCYNVLEAWMELAKQGYGLQAAVRAHELLDHLESNGFMLKTSMYDVVLQAYAVSGGLAPAATRAQALLERMVANCRARVELASATSPELSLPPPPPPPEPTNKTFNIVINSWSKSQSPNAGHRAEAVFGSMNQWGKECLDAARARSSANNDTDNRQPRQQQRHAYQGCLADIRSLNGVLIAWSKSGHPNAPERSLAILQRTMHAAPQDATAAVSSSSSNADTANTIQPNVTTFNAVIDTWVRSQRGREGATRAEELIETMIHWNAVADGNGLGGNGVVPDTRSYTLVLDAWARCEKNEQTGEAAKRAQDILFNMIRFYRQGLNVKPNLITFTTCIAAWARCKDAAAPENAEHLFDTLIELYKETGDRDFEPAAEVGNAVIAAWARAVHRFDSTDRALAALEKLTAFAKPDIISYNSVLSAYSKAGMGHKAMEMLKWLESKFEDNASDLQPDIISYNSVLAALAKGREAGATEQAEELLEKMEALARAGKRQVKPNKISYTTVIDAWSHSGIPGQEMRAYKLVARMIKSFEEGDLSIKPDVFVFSVLIKTCARVNGTQSENRQALKMAFDAMKALEKTDFGPPNHVAFLALMRAVNRLSSSESERRKLLSSVFQRCATGGHVSKQVMYEIEGSGLESMLSRTHKDWIRSVPPRDRPVLTVDRAM